MSNYVLHSQMVAFEKDLTTFRARYDFKVFFSKEKAEQYFENKKWNIQKEYGGLSRGIVCDRVNKDTDAHYCEVEFLDKDENFYTLKMTLFPLENFYELEKNNFWLEQDDSHLLHSL